EFFQRFFILLGKLKKDTGVRYLRFELLLPLDLSFQHAALLQQFLRCLLIVPKLRCGSLTLNARQLFTAGGDIKETSRAVRHARASRHTKLSILEWIMFLSLFWNSSCLVIRVPRFVLIYLMRSLAI